MAIYGLLQGRKTISLSRASLAICFIALVAFVGKNLLRHTSKHYPTDFEMGWPCPYYVMTGTDANWLYDGILVNAFIALLALVGIVALTEYFRSNRS